MQRDECQVFWGQMRLGYVGRHHLQFAGSGQYFLKASADAPETFLAYADFGGTAGLDLAAAPGSYEVRWFNPRQSGPLVEGSVRQLRGGRVVELGAPPADAGEDWLIVVKKQAL